MASPNVPVIAGEPHLLYLLFAAWIHDQWLKLCAQLVKRKCVAPVVNLPWQCPDVVVASVLS